MTLDLTEQVVQMQLVFGLIIVAFLLLWIAFVKIPRQGEDKQHKK